MNLTAKQKQWIAWLITVMVIAGISTFFGVNYPIPQPPVFTEVDDEIVALGTTNFTNISVEDATVTDDLAVTDDTSVGGDFTVTGNTTATGNVTHSALTIFSSTTITVTDGQHITPTIYTGYRLNAAGAVTITLAACSNDFQPLLLYGEDNQTILVADSNIRTNDGAAQSIGQYDLITWMCIDEDWVEVSESNNS